MGMILPDELGAVFGKYSVYIQQENLFGASRALVTKHRDGYLILIDQSLSFDATIESIKHELFHIINGDLDRDDPVEVIELENPY